MPIDRRCSAVALRRLAGPRFPTLPSRSAAVVRRPWPRAPQPARCTRSRRARWHLPTWRARPPWQRPCRRWASNPCPPRWFDTSSNPQVPSVAGEPAPGAYGEGTIRCSGPAATVQCVHPHSLPDDAGDLAVSTADGVATLVQPSRQAQCHHLRHVARHRRLLRQARHGPDRSPLGGPGRRQSLLGRRRHLGTGRAPGLPSYGPANEAAHDAIASLPNQPWRSSAAPASAAALRSRSRATSALPTRRAASASLPPDSASSIRRSRSSARFG